MCMKPSMKIFDSMKRSIITLFFAFFAATAFAQNASVADETSVMQTMEEYKIISDEVLDGVRHIVATPSEKVCSKQIDIRIKEGIILEVKYTRGCEGNAKGIGALIKGMTVEEAIRRLDGITCGKRGTSCPDQLAQILKSLK